MVHINPYWVSVRKPEKCLLCNRRIEKSAWAFFFPGFNGFFCRSEGCGHAMASEVLELQEHKSLFEAMGESLGE